MERNGISRNLEVSKIDGTKWNWKEPGNLNIRWKEMELEGTLKSQYQIPRAGERNSYFGKLGRKQLLTLPKNYPENGKMYLLRAFFPKIPRTSPYFC